MGLEPNHQEVNNNEINSTYRETMTKNMASCEKCWSDAYLRTQTDRSKRQSEHYLDLIEERYDKPCTGEEQAGVNAKVCIRCKTKTVRITTGECVTCGAGTKKIERTKSPGGNVHKKTNYLNIKK